MWLTIIIIGIGCVSLGVVASYLKKSIDKTTSEQLVSRYKQNIY